MHLQCHLGKGTLNEIRTVMSTYYLKLKFPTVKGNQAEARSCIYGIVRRLKPTDLMMVENSPQPEGEWLKIDMLDLRDNEKELKGKRRTIGGVGRPGPRLRQT